MLSRALPLVYERAWRPVLGRLLKAAPAASMADEQRLARLLLGLRPGDRVLDVACGPGSFSRDFARVVGGEGLVVGLDASPTMLARAVADTAPRTPIAYVRGDAAALPFADGAFDAACCFAALYLMDNPFGAVAEMARVLRPGGRVAILTSVRRGPDALRVADPLFTAGSGLRIFERDEITGALATRGFEGVTQRVTGFAQFVGGRKAS